MTRQVTVTSAVWQGLIARQFVYLPQFDGPTVTIIPDSTQQQPYIPPTYPLTPGSYSPFYPDPFAPLGLYPGTYAGPAIHAHGRTPAAVTAPAAPLSQPLPPAPPSAPAKDDRPVPRGSLPLIWLSLVK